MTVKRPTTPEEMAKLPVKSQFMDYDHLITPSERMKGEVELFGRKIPLDNPRARRIVVPVVDTQFKAVFHGENEPIGYTDENGIAWRLGQDQEGNWFRYLG